MRAGGLSADYIRIFKGLPRVRSWKLPMAVPWPGNVESSSFRRATCNGVCASLGQGRRGSHCGRGI